MKEKIEQLLHVFFNENKGEKVTNWNFQMLQLTIMNIIGEYLQLQESETNEYKTKISNLEETIKKINENEVEGKKK